MGVPFNPRKVKLLAGNPKTDSPVKCSLIRLGAAEGPSPAQEGRRGDFQHHAAIFALRGQA